LIAALVSRELLFSSRIASAFERAGISLTRVARPADLPPAQSVRVALVDWGDRDADWARQLLAWLATASESARPRVVLYGPHTDLDSHAAARAVGLGPMWARRKVLAELDRLVQLSMARDDRIAD
jgi:hypothetical protein